MSRGSIITSPEPLAIAVHARAGESLIGLIARAARLNVLGTTKVILESAGMDLLHPGTVGQDIGSQTHLLAGQLGCDPSDILERCHPYLADPTGPSDVRWGSGALFRQDLIVERRRISPATLETSDHHRADWMNLLLPFCPESLELLIDTCDSCDKPLGWRRAWGIGHCDDWRCRHRVGSTGRFIPEELSAGYRSFARLVSADPLVRDNAARALDPSLASLPPAVLLNLLLHLGATFLSPRIRLHRGNVAKLQPETIAAIGAKGTELLASWPDGLRTALAQEVSATSGAARRSLLKAVRRLGLPHSARQEQIEVIRAALPEAFEHATTALGGLVKPVVHGAAVCKMAAIDPAELRSLRHANLLEYRLTGEWKRAIAQYDLAAVTEFATRKRSSEFASRLEQRLGIPRYASEQLAWLGEVDHEEHPCILHLDQRLRLRSNSVAELVGDLTARGLAGDPPPECLKLRTAMKRIGGRLKPWGAILAAMRSGAMPYWLTNGRHFTGAAFVLLEDVEQFLGVDVPATNLGRLPIAEEMSQIDANDVLNLDALQIQRVVEAGELSFRPSGVSLISARDEVLRLAAQTISGSEIALRLRRDFRSARNIMATHYPTVRRSAVGWVRADFDAVFPDCAFQSEELRCAAL
jgi:hypothetical protein